MSQPRICPECHAEIPADAPQGVCPSCVLDLGIESEARTRSAGRSRHPPPLSPAQLNERLSELEVHELIGQGGMGTVYRARQRKLDRPVALKVLYPDLGEDAAFAARFAREARTLARLNHPNIVSVYDFGHRRGSEERESAAGEADLYYLVMELVEGVTLRQTIEAGGLEPKQALSIVPRICEALQYAHDRGIVHRDIKPENILIDREGRVKIADFGLAKLIGSTESRLTGTREVMGTPHYMAPEQIETPNRVDHRADIYALGVVFYELLTGELPVGRFPPPSKKVEIDVRLDGVVLRTLEKEPSLRFQRASELRSEVESLSSPGAPPPPPKREDSSLRFEYRSTRTLWGWPLVHIAFGRDPHGRPATARGVVAIGDYAIGAIAVGGMSVGGLSAGGISLGLISLGGLAGGLLMALGGMAIGGVAVGGGAVGLVAHGGASRSLATLSEPGLQTLEMLAWLTINGVVIAGLFALVPPLIRRAARRGRGSGGPR